MPKDKNKMIAKLKAKRRAKQMAGKKLEGGVMRKEDELKLEKMRSK